MLLSSRAARWVVVRMSYYRMVSRLLDVILLAAILAFAYYAVFRAGERGFFPLDQSIVFDGSYRVLSGQAPYRDFLIPIGPIVFWLQAIFFKIFGISYFSYILGAAVVNVLATACSIGLLRLLFPALRFVSYVAGILTAVWFYPPFGTPWPDQTAFFFSFFALVLLLLGSRHPGGRSIASELLVFCSGSFAGISFLSKQNVGTYLLPLFFALLLAANVPDIKRVVLRWAVFVAGLATAIAVFVVLLLSYADAKVFFQYFVSMPSALGIGRLFTGRLSAFESFVLPGSAMTNSWIAMTPLALAMFSVAVAVLLLLAINFRQVGDAWRKEFLAAILCSYGALFPYPFIITTVNSPENSLQFTGIVIGAGMGLTIHLFRTVSSVVRPQGVQLATPRRATVYALLVMGLLFSAAYTFALGVKVSLTREVHHVFQEASFPKLLGVERLEDLRWGQPTRMRRADIRGDSAVSIDEADLVGLYAYLKVEKKNFFIFPDFTILYAVLSVPSPQPVLWFHRGLTYPASYDSGLDERIVESLNRNNVEIVVVEEKSWYGTYNRLEDFPLLKSYIGESFGKVGEIGIFNLYKRKQ
ncbi:MAG: glycosyltransferase family 39 protein [Chloroflexi bacterium]|nr:glycosyltransferase family 39 protein [Chloroflexota bacterium]